jgi:hypothetical protein
VAETEKVNTVFLLLLVFLEALPLHRVIPKQNEQLKQVLEV